VSRLALEPTQPPVKWVAGGLSLGGKAAGAWSWPLTAIYCWGQECVELYLHSPNTPSWCGTQLKKHRDNFTFTFTFIFTFTFTFTSLHYTQFKEKKTKKNLMKRGNTKQKG